MFEPDGRQACEGVSGTCIEAGNFKSDKSDGQTVTQSEAVDSAVVGALSAAAQGKNSEAVFAFTDNNDGTVDANPIDDTETSGASSETIETTAGIPPGTTSVGHVHRSGSTSTVAGGFGDDEVVNNGRPNNIRQGSRIGVIEKVNGQFRMRLLSGRFRRPERGNLSNSEKTVAKERLRIFQRRIQE